MTCKSKIILLSQVKLPYNNIGSWTTMYNNYIKSSFNKIDCIVCPKTKNFYTNVDYELYINDFSLIEKIKLKLRLITKWDKVFLALKKQLKQDVNYTIKIVDNYGILIYLHKFLLRAGIRHKCKIIYFYHGFEVNIKEEKSKEFFMSLDKIVFLTNDSLKLHKNVYDNEMLSVDTHILHNGIDINQFYKIPDSEKIIQKNKLKIKNNKVFMWCSQDRPKKGLDFILGIWDSIYEKYGEKAILLVIGSNRILENKGVLNLGKIPNSDLVKYYQISDCYLFPTLWQEGFGMSLIEAKYCGAYCIASNIGGVPEVLDYGKYGNLIKNPFDKKQWFIEISNFIENNIPNTPFPEDLYSSKSWNINMNNILN